MWRPIHVFKQINFPVIGKKYITLDSENILNINRIVESNVLQTFPCILGLTNTYFCDIKYMKKELEFNSLGVSYFVTYSKGRGNITESMEHISVYFHTKNSLIDATQFKKKLDQLRKDLCGDT